MREVMLGFPLHHEDPLLMGHDLKYDVVRVEEGFSHPDSKGLHTVAHEKRKNAGNVLGYHNSYMAYWYVVQGILAKS